MDEQPSANRGHENASKGEKGRDDHPGGFIDEPRDEAADRSHDGTESDQEGREKKERPSNGEGVVESGAEVEGLGQGECGDARGECEGRKGEKDDADHEGNQDPDGTEPSAAQGEGHRREESAEDAEDDGKPEQAEALDDGGPEPGPEEMLFAEGSHFEVFPGHSAVGGLDESCGAASEENTAYAEPCEKHGTDDGTVMEPELRADRPPVEFREDGHEDEGDGSGDEAGKKVAEKGSKTSTSAYVAEAGRFAVDRVVVGGFAMQGGGPARESDGVAGRGGGRRIGVPSLDGRRGTDSRKVRGIRFGIRH